MKRLIACGAALALLAGVVGSQTSYEAYQVRFNCSMTSTAVTSTAITGCGSPGAGLRRYITGISYNSSIISTTANFMTLQYGTGAGCATGTTVVYRQANGVAFVPVIEGSIDSPIALGVATDLCFLHPGAGTRLINITGYIAP